MEDAAVAPDNDEGVGVGVTVAVAVAVALGVGDDDADDADAQLEAAAAWPTSMLLNVSRPGQPLVALPTTKLITNSISYSKYIIYICVPHASNMQQAVDTGTVRGTVRAMGQVPSVAHSAGLSGWRRDAPLNGISFGNDLTS